MDERMKKQMKVSTEIKKEEKGSGQIKYIGERLVISLSSLQSFEKCLKICDRTFLFLSRLFDSLFLSLLIPWDDFLILFNLFFVLFYCKKEMF